MLCDMQLPRGLNCLPSSLKVLHWRGCPLKTLPLNNKLDEVVDLKLPHSRIEQLWRGTKVKTIYIKCSLKFIYVITIISQNTNIVFLSKLLTLIASGKAKVHQFELFQEPKAVPGLWWGSKS